MKITLLHFILLLSTFTVVAQNNVLLLQKKHKSFHSFYTGSSILLETVDKNYADGVITKITHDSVFIRHFEIQESMSDAGGVYFDTAFRYTTAIHYKDIGAILFLKGSSSKKTNGTILMIAGGGVLVLGAVNGLYRGDPPKDWYKTSSFIVAGALTGLGLWLRKSADKKYTIGKKYQLTILPLSTR